MITFLGTVHWPAGGFDLGVGGISFVELLILYELCTDERLSLEKAHPRFLRPGRPISVSAVDIWRSCRFIGALMRSLCLLPGKLGRFGPCSIGANHCGLRHVGWEKCGHGLTSRPRERASELLLNELLSLFKYPPGFARALLAGALPLRYCAARPASRTPTWRLRESGQVARLVTADLVVADDDGVEGVCSEVCWVGGSGPGRKNSTKQKKPLHTSWVLVRSRPRVWKRLDHVGDICVSIPDRKRRRRDQDDVGNVPAQIRTGVG